MNLSKGWISLNREIQEHWLYKDKPFNQLSAWVDLLLQANHKYNKFPLGTEMIEVKRGSFITSERKLGERWGWSNTKVRNFLKLLESDQMIVKKTDSKKSTIAIVNYNVYQDLESTKTSQKKQTSITRASLEHTNNNDNNDNNVNKKDNSRFTPPTIEEVKQYCLERNNNVDYQKWFDFYEAKGWFVGKNKMKNWKAAVRTWESKSNQQTTKSYNKFNQFPQRNNNYDDLEKRLLAQQGR